MKKAAFRVPSSLQLLIPFFFITSFLFAQAPQGIPYQAVMRNADGSIMSSTPIDLTFIIHDSAATGAIVYQESHSLITNAQGLVSCVVGNGAVSEGNFANISWGSGAKFLHVKLGTLDLGTQQMLSVPYALYAEKTANSLPPGGEEGQQLTICNGAPTWTFDGFCPTPLPNSLRDTCDLIEGINLSLGYGNLIDQDGYSYKTIQIGTQEWMAENLKTSIYGNGNAIENDRIDYYNGDSSFICPYGRLYNWNAVVDVRGLCPTGWKMPDADDWNILIQFMDSSPVLRSDYGYEGLYETLNSGGRIKNTGSSYWINPSSSVESNLGFEAIPSGMIDMSNNSFGLGTYCWFWSTSTVLNDPLSYMLTNESFVLDRNSGDFKFSVRCIKNE